MTVAIEAKTMDSTAYCFVDTNIFVYAHDQRDLAKRQKARELIIGLLTSGHGVISYQVIQEFAHVMLKKLQPAMRTEECEDIILQALSPMLRVQSSMELFQSALSVKAQTGYQWYDSLMLAAALQAKCSVFYSEDLQHHGLVRGMKIVNPFV
jgi:predicted nucleic acid-binding protein